MVYIVETDTRELCHLGPFVVVRQIILLCDHSFMSMVKRDVPSFVVLYSVLKVVIIIIMYN